MVVRIVGIVEVIPRVIDYGVVALYRKGRFKKGFLGVITIEKPVGGACGDDL